MTDGTSSIDSNEEIASRHPMHTCMVSGPNVLYIAVRGKRVEYWSRLFATQAVQYNTIQGSVKQYSIYKEVKN